MRVTDLPPARTKPFRTSFLDAASKLGLVGAFEGPEDLARNHSRYLKAKLRARRRAKAKAAR
jgi:hypothetical protein